MNLELLYGNYYQDDLKEILESCGMPTEKIQKGLKLILRGDENIGGCRVIFSNDEKSALLCSVCISPKYQSNGYGSKMLQMVHVLLENNGVEHYYLASVSTAVGFYKKYGYKETSISEVPVEFTKIMWRIYSEYERSKSDRRISSFMKYSLK